MKKKSGLCFSIALCSITDVGLETFSNEMSRGIKEVTPGIFALNLREVPL